MKIITNTSLIASVIVAASSLASTSAQAATSADLIIKGQISPPACNLSFADSTVDFGTRSFGSLNFGGTVLPTQTATMNIACTGATRVSFSAVDNRPGTAIASSEVTVWPSVANSTEKWAWGLGSTGSTNAKIGAVEIAMPMDKAVVNGSATALNVMQLIWGDLGGTTFTRYTASNTLVHTLSPARHYSFGVASPVPISSASIPLSLSAVIARPATLPAEDEITLDGSLTFSLHYL